MTPRTTQRDTLATAVSDFDRRLRSLEAGPRRGTTENVLGVDTTGQVSALAAINGHIQNVSAAGGGFVDLPGGDLLIGGGYITLLDKVYLRMTPSTRLIQGYWASGWGNVIRARGTTGTTGITTLAADVGAGSATITVANGAALTVGQWYRLESSARFNTVAPSPTGYQGELVRVRSISGNTITLYGVVRDDYLVADSTKLTGPLGFIRTGVIGGTIENPSQNTSTAGLVLFELVKDMIAEDITMRYSDRAGLDVNECLGGRATAIVTEDFSNNSGAGRFGYGIEVAGATQGLRVEEARNFGGRHATVTAANLWSFNTVIGGVPRDITHVQCHAEGVVDESAFDTHPNGANVGYLGCVVTNSKMGFVLRGPDSWAKSCRAEWVGMGYWLSGSGSELSGSDARHMVNALFPNNAVAVKVSAADNTAPVGVKVLSNTLEYIDRHGITVETTGALAPQHTILDRNSVFNWGLGDTSKFFGAVTLAGGTNTRIPRLTAHKLPETPEAHTYSRDFDYVVKISAGVSGTRLGDLDVADYLLSAVQDLGTGTIRRGYNNDKDRPVITTGRFYLGADPNSPSLHSGNGNPEARDAAWPGSFYLRKDGEGDNAHWFKEWGTGTRGWGTKAAPAFLPTSLPNLAGWYAAEKITGVAHQGALLQWDDLSGNARHLIAVAGTEPTYRNSLTEVNSDLGGLAVVHFDDTTLDVMRTNAFTAIAQPLTVYVLVWPWSAGGTRAYIDGILSTNRMLIGQSTTVRLNAGTVLQGGNASASWQLHTGLFNGTSSVYRRNGTQEATGDAGAQSVTGFSVGAHNAVTGLGYLLGQYAEIIVYAAAHTSAQMQQVETYMLGKRGLI